MTEKEPQPTTSQKTSDPISDNAISIIAIVGVIIVLLACITSCTLLGYVFFSNPPW